MKDGATALFIASQNAHMEINRELLRLNIVDLNAQIKDGATVKELERSYRN
jgi:ankyrin repeat protein